MSQSSMSATPQHHAIRKSVLRALWQSVFLNIVCAYLLYRFFAPRFHPGSLLPLAISGLPPLAGLAYGFVRKRTIDFIGFFAVEDIAVSMVSLILAHSETSALIGRSLQNSLLGVIFLGSLVFNKPLALYISRQFVTGNETDAMRHFDRVAAQPDARTVYRTITWVWSAVLFAKSAGSVLLALTLSAQNYLVVSPVWTFASDALLVWWSLRYGYAKLKQYTVEPEYMQEEPVASVTPTVL